MQQSVIRHIPKFGIQIYIVWIKIFEVDAVDAAQEAANLLGTDFRVMQFYDPEQLLGKTIAEGFGAETGKVAWDIYLFYDREGVWDDRVPTPIDWVHQIQGNSWADPSRLHQGEELTQHLKGIMEKLSNLDHS